MKNKFLRLIRLGAVSALLVPILTLAAFDDVTLSSGSTLGMTVGGSALNFTATDGVLQSITVDASSVDFTMAAGSTLTVSSADRRTFTYSVNRAAANFTCTDSTSIISFSLGAGESNETVTLTPTGNICSTSSGGGGGGGGGGGDSGGGGGGGGSVSPAPEPTPTPTPAPTTAALVITSVPAVAVAQPSPVAQAVSPVFNSDLSLGSKGDDVTKLQELMAKDSEIYPEGLVTGYFGPATQRAVRKFQAKHGLPQVGRVGPATRAKLNETSGVPTVTQPSPVAQVVSPVFNSDLSLGSKGDDVTKLQELMAKDSEIYPEGLVTGYFGPATQRAVRKFQAKHGLPQVGRVGPATRAKLNEVSGGQPQSSAPAPAPAPAAAASAVSASEQKSMEDQLKSLQDLLKVLQQQTGQ